MRYSELHFLSTGAPVSANPSPKSRLALFGTIPLIIERLIEDAPRRPNAAANSTQWTLLMSLVGVSGRDRRRNQELLIGLTRISFASPLTTGAVPYLLPFLACDESR
jgi:hypothetical protein